MTDQEKLTEITARMKGLVYTITRIPGALVITRPSGYRDYFAYADKLGHRIQLNNARYAAKAMVKSTPGAVVLDRTGL